MKKILVGFLLGFVLFSSIGCQTASTTAPDKRIYSFLNITLGTTRTEVASALGAPLATDSNSNLSVYYYDGTYFHVVGYNTDNKAVWVATTSDDFQLQGIGVGHSRNYVQSLLGNPDKIDTADVYYKWFYNIYGTAYYFYKSNDTCYEIGIYSGSY